MPTKRMNELKTDEDWDQWVIDLIREAKEEQGKKPMSPEEIVRELKEFGQEVAQKAKEQGITSKDVNRIIYESRKRWGSS